VDQRRRRLADAITLFDAATVTTTHGFCQQVLLGLGTAGDYDPGAILVETRTRPSCRLRTSTTWP
jgi:exodeoxyribonuclease V beta subunit